MARHAILLARRPLLRAHVLLPHLRVHVRVLGRVAAERALAGGDVLRVYALAASRHLAELRATDSAREDHRVRDTERALKCIEMRSLHFIPSTRAR